MASTNTSDKNNEIAVWFAALLFSVCMLSAPLHASNVNIIDQKDTIIILFDSEWSTASVATQIRNEESMILTNSLIGRVGAADNPTECRSVQKSLFPDSMHDGRTIVSTNLIESEMRDATVDKNSLLQIKKEDLYGKLSRSSGRIINDNAEIIFS